MSNLLGTIGSAQTWVSQQWTQRVVQVSVYAAVVFFLLSNYSLIKIVEKNVKSVSGLKLGNEGTLVLHSVIFGLFMYVGTRFILDPILVKATNGRVEGATNIVSDKKKKVKKGMVKNDLVLNKKKAAAAADDKMALDSGAVVGAPVIPAMTEEDTMRCTTGGPDNLSIPYTTLVNIPPSERTMFQVPFNEPLCEALRPENIRCTTGAPNNIDIPYTTLNNLSPEERGIFQTPFNEPECEALR